MTAPVTDWIEGSQGLRLFCRSWMVEKPRALLVFVHGLSEHSGRYLHTADYFVSKGFSVFAFDQRGHGRSQGTRIHADSLDQFLEDLDLFIQKVRRGNSAPLFVIGHSFGGQVLSNYAAKDYPMSGKAKGYIFSSPNIRLALPIGPVKAVAGRILSHIVPRFPLPSEIPADRISHDPAVVADYKRDPLVERKITTRLGDLILSNQEILFSLARSIKKPTLWLHAGADEICSPEGTRAFFEKIPVEDKEFRIYEGFYHEIFNEVGKERVYRDVEKWIEKHL